MLAASHVFTPFAKSDAPAPDLQYAELHVVDRGVTGPGVMRLAYRDTAPDSNQIPVVLVQEVRDRAHWKATAAGC